MGAFAWNILLALIWVAVSGDLSGAGLLTGFVLGYIILGLTLRELPVFAAYVRRVPKIFRFAGYFLKELVRSNLRVAWDVVTPTHYMKPAVIAVPLEARTEGEIALLAELVRRLRLAEPLPSDLPDAFLNRTSDVPSLLQRSAVTAP